MCPMSGYIWSYLLVSFGHVQNFERMPTDKVVKDVWWMNVTCALVSSLWGSHVVGNLSKLPIQSSPASEIRGSR